ncbi:MAG: DegT/DnrJ/EryC1/StrS family aminotransferase [Burkholderiales bacterium]|nr:DegT/DnrJ/EryC1/StrS family aminotransferase [Burkholderiales bacterium]
MTRSDNARVEFVDLKVQYAAMKDAIDARIRDVLAHTQFILGPEVAELEQRLAAFTGARHCITCASGTEALLIALMALDVKPGDEVITTPFTFVATAEMIVLLGATPVFVDVEGDTCNIDASRIAAAITPRTRAIMPVSLYGQPPDMDEINALAARHGIAVVEDAAQSLGALYKGRRSCNLSTIGCTSFFPSKPLGCYGDGGALFTSDDALAAAMKEIRTHGQSGRYHHTRIGVGGRMDTIQCAVVLAKLEHFEREIARRIEVARRYDALLAERVPDLRLVAVRPDRTSVYAQYTVMTPRRDALQTALRARGIPTAVHYPTPLHRQPAYTRHATSALPVSEKLGTEVVSLPMHAYLDPGDQDRVVEAIRGALGGAPAGARTG